MYIGLIIILILLWIRPEYLFLLFYVVANYLLIFLIFDIWTLTWSTAGGYAIYMGSGAAITFVLGLPVVALFKWLKTRKTDSDKKLDREMEAIRAEIATGDGQPPAAQ